MVGNSRPGHATPAPRQGKSKLPGEGGQSMGVETTEGMFVEEGITFEGFHTLGPCTCRQVRKLRQSDLEQGN